MKLTAKIINNIRHKLQQGFDKYDIPIEVAKNLEQICEVTQFVNQAYEKDFPNLPDDHSETYRQNSLNLFSRDNNGQICASMSFVIDSKQKGLPEEQYFAKALAEPRKSNKKILQIGRFVKAQCKDTQALTLDYVQLPYLVPWIIDYDIVVGMVRECDVNLYVNRYGAKIIERCTGETYGGQNELSTLMWVLSDIKPNFVQKAAKTLPKAA